MDLRIEAMQFEWLVDNLSVDPADAAWTEIVKECKAATSVVTLAAFNSTGRYTPEEILAEMMKQENKDRLKDSLLPPYRHAKKYEGSHASDAKKVVRQINQVFDAAGIKN